MISIRAATVAAAIAIASTTGAFAQTTVEVYGGVSAPRVPRAGSLTLPPAGPPILTSNPIFPSRQTASWFFGDGAALLNDAAADLGLLNRIAPIDSALSTLPFQHSAGGAFGGRLRFGFRKRFELEAAVDVTAGSQPGGGFTSAVDAAQSSFQDTFAALFASGPFVNTTVEATSTIDRGSSRRVSLTGALIVPVGRLHGMAPYVVVGGGVMSTFGTAASASLSGHYRTTARAGAPTIDVPIEEFDRLTITFQERTSPVGLGGAGLTRSLGGTWALRIDARALVGLNTTRVLADATPSSTTGAPPGFIELFTFPALEFSNNPSTGRQSTLSGSGLHGVTIFEGSGVAVHTTVTVGIVKRF